jgi:hypothetical protein
VDEEKRGIPVNNKKPLYQPNTRERIKQWRSIQITKRPSQTVLACILGGSALFVVLAALAISYLYPDPTHEYGFWSTLFYTVTMILDAGCISYIVDNPNSISAIITVTSLLTVFVGAVVFTGGIIGYASNLISNFINNVDTGKQRLHFYNHTVVLNWNSRASEIVNDLIYTEQSERIVILVEDGKEEVENEISNRLADTLALEERKLGRYCRCQNMTRWQSKRYIAKKLRQLRNHLTIIVRQGDTFSTKQLMDITLDKAKTVIILTRDETARMCRYASEDRQQTTEKGNALTIKTLVLVAEITAAESSADNQKIIVEVDDDWTLGLVKKIISHKEKLGKCNIVPVAVNQVLGQLLAQFSIMPELNSVYFELFSNLGSEFYCRDTIGGKEQSIQNYFSTHYHAIPLTTMNTKNGLQSFFMANREEEVDITVAPERDSFTVHCDPGYWLPRRNILILGHNSKVASLMDGFAAFREEWNPAKDGRDILNIHVIDTEKSLNKLDNYRKYPYVQRVVAAELFDQELIYKTINDFIDDQDGDTGILILSDDTVPSEDLDASALTYLVYVQDIMSQRKEKYGGKDIERIDVVVEILNPKNYDVVHSYSVDNVVISNRYISKMITQIGEKEALFEFYQDILTYDTGENAQEKNYISKELYIKRAGDVFSGGLPGPCTAAELIRAVYRSVKEIGEENTAIVLGYFPANPTPEFYIENNLEPGDIAMQIFAGDQRKIKLLIQPDDKLIMFSNH